MGYDYLDKPFPKWIRGDTEQRFTEIYKRRFWGNSGSVSGPGSNVEQARELLVQLPLLVQRLEISSFLDIPCGDFNWMKSVALPVRRYVGADIVAELIEENRGRYGDGQHEFLHLNMITDNLPSCDLICCRDGLVHLDLESAVAALRNFRRSGAAYLLATTFPSCTVNRDVQTGDWRPLNLELAPFDLGPASELLVENCPEEGYEDKALGLWRLA